MQNFYGKVCVAGSIKFFADENREERDLKSEEEKFSCNLATILARDTEVVAIGVRLVSDKCIVYISKNGNWYKKDVEYINKIKNFMKNISKDAPKLNEVFKRNEVGDLFKVVFEYCSAKYKTRVEKLMKDIDSGPNEEYILSFKNAVYAEVGNISNMGYHELSRICSTYYKTAKNTTTQETTDKYLKFLRHLKKVGSYNAAIVNITICACNIVYKELFSNLDVQLLAPVTTTQHISSWKKITQLFIPDQKEYEKFKERCFVDFVTRSKLNEIYGDQLDEEINKHIYLHAELNILAKIVDQDYKGRMFVAVSKKCCYLCDQYIKFARDKGYNIITSGTHNRIYHKWMLPHPRDTTFKKEAQSYILAKLNSIISEEIAKHVSVQAISDSEAESIDGVVGDINDDVKSVIKTNFKDTTMYFKNVFI